MMRPAQRPVAVCLGFASSAKARVELNVLLTSPYSSSRAFAMAGSEFISLKVVYLRSLHSLRSSFSLQTPSWRPCRMPHDFDVFQHFGDLAAAEGAGCLLCAPLQVV